MLSASCPSCGSPLRFQHAAAPVVVCEACQSTVVRSDLDELVIQGKVSAFARDLSPIAIGTSGRVGNRRFEVVGVLRKGRKSVRWNEWFVVYDDGGHAWLGEGHGVLQLYEEKPVRVRIGSFGALQPGQQIQPGEGAKKWRVIEVSEAKVIAAEGSLPFPVVQDQSWPYADLRSVDGSRVGTIDGADNDTLLYTGRVVELLSLEPEGLRPLAGWSDDALVNFEGPEIEGTRTINCPSCHATIELWAPGHSARVGCEYCGSELALGELGDQISTAIVQQRDRPEWTPQLPLGVKGVIDGVEYAIIGAMRRGVLYAGEMFAWTEYFLYNPYRGVAFLVCDGGGHWNLVKRLVGVPRPHPHKLGQLDWRGVSFKSFQSGEAQVLNVLGEFDWEVHAGEIASTGDYISAPYMLSVEKTGEEITWSLGTYTDHEEVSEAFDTKLRRPGGVAPNQPNPYQGSAAWGRVLLQMAVLMLGVVLFWALNNVVADQEVLVEEGMSLRDADDQVDLSEYFEIPDTMRRSIQVHVDSNLSRSTAQVQVALINKETGRVYLPVDTRSSNTAKGWVNRPEPGLYLARLEVAFAPTANELNARNKTATVRVVRDVPWQTPFLIMFLFSIIGPPVLLVLSARFESARWAESDHA